MLRNCTKTGACTAFMHDSVTVAALTRRGLVTWYRNGGTKYGWGSNTATVHLTEEGRKALAALSSSMADEEGHLQ